MLSRLFDIEIQLADIERLRNCRNGMLWVSPGETSPGLGKPLSSELAHRMRALNTSQKADLLRVLVETELIFRSADIRRSFLDGFSQPR